MPPNVTWIKANANQSGYYRVNYDSATWNTLVRVLNTKPATFSPSDRAQLIDDAFTLTWYVSYFVFTSSLSLFPSPL